MKMFFQNNKIIIVALFSWLFVNGVNGQYCSPTNQTNANFSDAISSFTLSNLANTSQSPTIKTNNCYSDNTNLSPINLVVGSSYSPVITAGGSNAHTANVWIDYNKNQVFEATEMVSSYSSSGSGTFTLSSFTVPNNVGTTRLRIQWVYNAAPNACTIPSMWGETEDYLVDIVSPPSCTGTPTPGSVASPLVLCAATNSFVLKTDTPLASSVTGQWEQSTTGVGGWTNLSGATTNPYTVTGGIVSPMYYRFKATCTSTSLSAYSDVITVTTTTGTYAFGNNEWITYGFNSQYTHTQYKDLSTVFTDYKGFYTQKLDVATNYGFNTEIAWNKWDSPAKSAAAFNNAAGNGSIWYGCSDALGVAAWNGSNNNDGRMNYSYISKRKGFPTGNYKITLTKWDDDTYIFVNGQRVAYTNEYIGSNNAWGTNQVVKNCIYLDANSTIEVRSHGGGTPNSVIIDILPVNIVIDVNLGTGFSMCHGIQEVLYATTNHSNAGTVTYSWTGNGIISGGSTLSPTVLPTATTTYQIKATYENCADSASLTITLPAKTDILSGNGEAATCFVKGTNPVHFYEPTTGHYIGSINPQGKTGTLTMTSYVTTFGSAAGVNDGTMYSCNSFGSEAYRTAYMKRSFVVNGSAIGNTNKLRVYFPFTDGELSDLITRSSSSVVAVGNSAGNNADNVTDINGIYATKFDASAGNSSFENNTPTDNCGRGGSVVISSSARGNLAGSTPFTLPQVMNATSNYRYVMFEVANFSEFNFHGQNNNSPLPIELLSFTATPNNRQVDLAWQTATETNNSYFEVEKTINGTDWEFVCKQNGAGNSTTVLSYTDVDKNPYMGTSYYRLKQVDFDGQYTYSQIETVNFNGQSETIVYPNPNKGDFTVKMIAETAGNTTITLFDNLGKILVSQENTTTKGVNFWNISTTDLPNGIYFLQIQNKDNEVIKLEIAH